MKKLIKKLPYPQRRRLMRLREQYLEVIYRPFLSFLRKHRLIQSQPIPNIGDIVEYGYNSFGDEVETYRVNSWMRVAPPPVLNKDDWLSEILFDGCADHGGPGKKMQWCLKEEATHVSLSGICGAIALIEKCKIIGVVPWSKEMLDEALSSAVRKGVAKQMLF